MFSFCFVDFSHRKSLLNFFFFRNFLQSCRQIKNNMFNDSDDGRQLLPDRQQIGKNSSPSGYRQKEEIKEELHDDNVPPV
jgi:hypothetical protein